MTRRGADGNRWFGSGFRVLADGSLSLAKDASEVTPELTGPCQHLLASRPVEETVTELDKLWVGGDTQSWHVTRRDSRMLSVQELLYGRKGVRLRVEHEPYLAAVGDAAREYEARRAALTTAIVRAREADVPFRAIAVVAGLSHEQVRRIAKADRPDS
jgi:hypothetical protein